MSGDVIMAIVNTVFLLGLLTWGLWPLCNRALFRWAVRFGVEISRDGRDQVIHDLERSKRLRWGAAVLGMAISSLPVYVNLISSRHAADFAGEGFGLVWIGAAALGAMVAEAVIHQHPRGPRAILERRRWTDFVPARPVRLTFAATGLGVVGAVFALVRHTEHAGTAAGAATCGLVGVVFLVVGLRRIVNRPRIALTGEARELDDAMRADGAHHIVGAALALSTFTASTAIVEGTWSVFPLIGFVLLPLQYYSLAHWWSLSAFAFWEITPERQLTA